MNNRQFFGKFNSYLFFFSLASDEVVDETGTPDNVRRGLPAHAELPIKCALHCASVSPTVCSQSGQYFVPGLGREPKLCKSKTFKPTIAILPSIVLQSVFITDRNTAVPTRLKGALQPGTCTCVVRVETGDLDRLEEKLLEVCYGEDKPDYTSDIDVAWDSFPLCACSTFLDSRNRGCARCNRGTSESWRRKQKL